MSKIGTFRMGLGVILGAAAGISLFYYYYYYYRQKRKKIWRKDRCTSPNSQREQNALNPQEHTEILRPYNQVPRIRPVPMEGGDNDPYVALLTREEQAEVLNRLDFVLRSLKELRNEVEELRNSLQGLAGEIIGEVRTHIEESQKFVRRRRFVYPRERSDSTGSSSIYFTASLDATNTDDGESEGG